MPQSWISQSQLLQDKLRQEIAQAEIDRRAKSIPTAVPTTAVPDTTQQWQPMVNDWQPQTQFVNPTPQPTIQPDVIPQPVVRKPIATVTAPVTAPTTAVNPTATTTPVSTPPTAIPNNVPFWKRALDVFNAPFKWIDDYVIKPTLGIIADPLVPDAVRKQGEDYFSWKRRSWEEWNAPGINLKMPWGNWRVDVKGIAELAPWLLVPGAGEITSAIRGLGEAAKGISMLEKLAPAIEGLAKVVEYSPWGFVEKGTGAIMSKGIKTVMGTTDKLSTQVGEKVFGKMKPEVPITPEADELLSYLKETVSPAYNKWRKGTKYQEAGFKTLRKEQGAFAKQLSEEVSAGKITATQATEQAGKGWAKEHKSYYALTPEALAQRQADDIAAVNQRMSQGLIQPKDAKALITRITNGPQYQSKVWDATKVENLLQPVYNSAEKYSENVNTAMMLKDLLTVGEVPPPRFWEKIRPIYGNEFADGLKKFSLQPLSVREKALDWLNMPRALLSSTDLSATLRQGLIMTITHPLQVPRAMLSQFKAFASEKLSQDMYDNLLSKDITKKFMRDFDGYIAPLSEKAGHLLKEESFPSAIADKIPLIRRSNRAFVTYLNEMRVASFEPAYNAMMAQGATDAEIKSMAKFINLSSGRGELPAWLDKHSDILNTIFFSPRLQASRLELPSMLGKMLISDNPYMRKESVKALATFLGGGTALLTLLNATGAGKVEIDPRSADFGKIKIGDTRYDIWTGYLQYARFAVQLITGESKSAYGNINKQGRDETAWRFLQSKASPAFGLVVDLLRGQNYQGQPLFNDTNTALTAVGQRIVPLALQDLMDGFQQNGTNGLLKSIPSTLGVGVLTYVNKFTQMQNQLAKQNGAESWSELDPLTQRKLEQTPAYQAASLEFDRQSMGTAWGDWRSAGNAIEDNFSNYVVQASNGYTDPTSDSYMNGVTYRKKISDAYTARRGAYDARSKDERFSEIVSRLDSQTPQEALVKMGAEQMAIKTYNDAMYDKSLIDQFGDYNFEEADRRRDVLKQSMGQQMFDYVEAYLGVKYDALPPIFQELRKAQQTLKPYWQVQNQVEATYGKAQNNWQQTRIDSLISRLRKRMRMADPQIAKYYDMFYKTPTATY